MVTHVYVRQARTVTLAFICLGCCSFARRGLVFEHGQCHANEQLYTRNRTPHSMKEPKLENCPCPLTQTAHPVAAYVLVLHSSSIEVLD